MSKDPKEKAARSLERKIVRAIERGEFVPVIGYLMTESWVPRIATLVPVGPCGCMLAAAASVCGLKGYASQNTLLNYLEQHGIARHDAYLLESGYEASEEDDGDITNPYYQVGQRLRRFHPHADGRAE